VRYRYHFKYLPLSACHERQHGAELQQISQAIGLLLSLDGLMLVGGKAQLWVVHDAKRADGVDVAQWLAPPTRQSCLR